MPKPSEYHKGVARQIARGRSNEVFVTENEFKTLMHFAQMRQVSDPEAKEQRESLLRVMTPEGATFVIRSARSKGAEKFDSVAELQLPELLSRGAGILSFTEIPGDVEASSRADVSPPSQFEGALYFFLPREVRQSLPGDLREEYQTIILPKFGRRFADRWYRWQVMTSIGSMLLRRVAKIATLGWVIDAIRRRLG